MRMRAWWKVALLLMVSLLLGAFVAYTDVFGLRSSLRGQQSQAEVEPSRDPIANPTRFDPLNAEVPSLCDHPAGRLTAGSLPATQGGILVKKDLNQNVLAASDDPKSEAAVMSTLAISCNKGGVAWPDTIAAYDKEAQLVGFVTLDAVTHGGRESVLSISINDGLIEAVWTTQASGDPECCGTVTATSGFLLQNSVLVSTDLELESEEKHLRPLLEGINGGSIMPKSKMQNDAVSELIKIGQNEGKLTLDKCYGKLNSSEIRPSVLENFRDPLGNIEMGNGPDGDLSRFCVVTAETGFYFVIGYWKNNGIWSIGLVAH